MKLYFKTSDPFHGNGDTRWTVAVLNSRGVPIAFFIGPLNQVKQDARDYAAKCYARANGAPLVSAQPSEDDPESD